VVTDISGEQITSVFLVEMPSLKMEVVRLSETMITICKATQSHNPEDHNPESNIIANLRESTPRHVYSSVIFIPMRLLSSFFNY
jgi:hypothetical protein